MPAELNSFKKLKTQKFLRQIWGNFNFQSIEFSVHHQTVSSLINMLSLINCLQLSSGLHWMVKAVKRLESMFSFPVIWKQNFISKGKIETFFIPSVLLKTIGVLGADIEFYCWPWECRQDLQHEEEPLSFCVSWSQGSLFENNLEATQGNISIFQTRKRFINAKLFQVNQMHWRSNIWAQGTTGDEGPRRGTYLPRAQPEAIDLAQGLGNPRKQPCCEAKGLALKRNQA